MKVVMNVLLVVVSLVGIHMVTGLPLETSTRRDRHHASNAMCETMSVRHGNSQPSNETAPYEITVSGKKVAPGSAIRVRLAGVGTATYKGVYVQGRVNNVPVGRFVKVTDNPVINISDCPPGAQNAASYISRSEAVNEVVLDWYAPDSAGENVVFKATFVKTFAEYWEGLTTDPIPIAAE